MICANKVANETKIIDRTKIVFDDNRDNIALESILLERLGDRRSVKYGKEKHAERKQQIVRRIIWTAN